MMLYSWFLSISVNVSGSQTIHIPFKLVFIRVAKQVSVKPGLAALITVDAFEFSIMHSHGRLHQGRVISSLGVSEMGVIPSRESCTHFPILGKVRETKCTNLCLISYVKYEKLIM